MHTDFVRRRDLQFLLYEVLDTDALLARPLFAGHDRTSCDAVVDAGHQLAREHFAPHAKALDEDPPRFDGQRVEIMPAVPAALRAYIDAGFLSAPFEERLGGIGLPYVVTCAAQAAFPAANAATNAYMFLTAAAANLLSVHGTPEQQRLYMKPLIEGRYFGTMALSEPQAGSSLGDIRTTAYPQADGSYHIKGSKMWISGAEHDMAENIVNLMLARIDGAPAGTRGISLFIVPRHRVNADGSRGARNGVRLVGLNHKMGYRGTVNCALSMGDPDPCTGYLVGAPHQGLACMFHMMNEARVGVGLGAAVMGYAGYLASLEYARHRPQGRKLDNKDPASPPVPIIRHADVRRMLLRQKSYVEGGLALCLLCARLVDEERVVEGPARAEVHELLELLTPIAKSWPSEFCLEANKLAIQVLGGAGYTQDYPVERLYRDNRLNPIHEGTAGVQALDLLGRKVMRGQGLAHLRARIARTLAEAGAVPVLAEAARDLAAALARCDRVTHALRAALEQHGAERALANASAYLDMLGHVVVAWMWLQQALRAQQAIGACPESDREFYAGKLAACRYFYVYELPAALRNADLLERLDDTCLTLSEAAF